MKFLPGAHQTISKNWKWFKNYMAEQIKKHKEDWNPSESRDYIDSYLQEIAKVSKAEQSLLQQGLEMRRDEKRAQILQLSCLCGHLGT